MKQVNIFLLLRFVVAGVFLVSGTEKLLSPSENFLYVIENYQVLPWPVVQRLVAVVFPWLELILGAFLLLGLWTRVTLWGVGLMTGTFIGVVGQAIVRHLPIESCGCFGELVKVPLTVIVAMDSTILLLVIGMARYLARTTVVSLDQVFRKK